MLYQNRTVYKPYIESVNISKNALQFKVFDRVWEFKHLPTEALLTHSDKVIRKWAKENLKV